MLTRILFAVLLAFGLGGAATAASTNNGIQQSGTVTPGHLPCWVTSGVVQDCGVSTNGNINTLGITRDGGTPFCIQDTKNHSGPYYQMCMGINSSTAHLDVNGYNTGTDLPFVLNLNGTAYPFPSSAGGIATVANVATLRASSALMAAFMLIGYSTPTDMGGGYFVYVSTDTTSSDNGGTILVDASGHRYYRVYVGPPHNSWFGAKNNRSTDDSTANQNCVNAAAAAVVGSADHGECFIDSGQSVQTATLEMPNQVGLNGVSASSSYLWCQNSNPCVHWGNSAISGQISVKNITVFSAAGSAIGIFAEGDSSHFGVGLRLVDMNITGFISGALRTTYINRVMTNRSFFTGGDATHCTLQIERPATFDFDTSFIEGNTTGGVSGCGLEVNDSVGNVYIHNGIIETSGVPIQIQNANTTGSGMADVHISNMDLEGTVDNHAWIEVCLGWSGSAGLCLINLEIDSVQAAYATTANVKAAVEIKDTTGITARNNYWVFNGTTTAGWLFDGTGNNRISLGAEGWPGKIAYTFPWVSVNGQANPVYESGGWVDQTAVSLVVPQGSTVSGATPTFPGVGTTSPTITVNNGGATTMTGFVISSGAPLCYSQGWLFFPNANTTLHDAGAGAGNIQTPTSSDITTKANSIYQYYFNCSDFKFHITGGG